jgi:hypothetical protein
MGRPGLFAIPYPRSEIRDFPETNVSGSKSRWTEQNSGGDQALDFYAGAASESDVLDLDYSESEDDGLNLLEALTSAFGKQPGRVMTIP